MSIVQINSKREATGETDWARTSDLENMYELEYNAYGEEAGNPAIVRKWCDRNSHICRVLYNKSDRRDFWGSMMMLPLKEEIIFKLLRSEIRDIDLNPESDILSFEETGTYDFYVASIIVSAERKQHFLTLMNSMFSFWCEEAPERIIGKIYVRTVSTEGEMLTRKLFFSPRQHFSNNVYMLDMKRPSPSRFIRNFQYNVNLKSEGCKNRKNISSATITVKPDLSLI